MMGDQLVREGEVNFAKPLARSLLRDARLSWGARGLFAFLWDLPGGWRPNASHIAKMGPDGRDAVRARLAELEAVGALRIEPIRGDGGQLAGKRWVLVAPERWAREASLSGSEPPEPLSGESLAEERVSRSSANAKVVKSLPKVLQKKQGSPTTTYKDRTSTSHQQLAEVVVEQDESLANLRSALVAEAKTAGKRNPEAWAGAAIRRIRLTGATSEDLALLARWRASEAAELAHRARLNRAPSGMGVQPSAESAKTVQKTSPPAGWDAAVRG